jgi:recombination protein RecA
LSKLDQLIKEFNREAKEIIVARGIKRITTNKIPFSSPRINYMLYGGLPRGRLIEFAGEEGGGKTTTALDIVANAQKLFLQEWEQEVGKLQAIEKPTKAILDDLQYLQERGPKQVVYADCENTLDEEWAQKLGVDLDNVVIIRPMSQTAEQIFEMLLQMIETDQVGLVVIDSLAVMLSQQAYEKDMTERTYGGISMALTLFSKKAEMLCARHDCTIIGINQLRENLNSPYGGTITPGGRAWRHACSVRLEFRKGSFIDDKGTELRRSAETPAGNLVQVHIAKTKVCKPDRRTGFYTLNYDYGIDAVADLVDTAILYGFIRQAGAWFTFVDGDTGEVIMTEEEKPLQIQGRANVIDYLKANKAFWDKLGGWVQREIMGA